MRLVARTKSFKTFIQILTPALILLTSQVSLAQAAKRLFLKMNEINRDQSHRNDLSPSASQSIIAGVNGDSKGSGMFDGYYVESLRRSGEQAIMGSRPSEIDPKQTSLVARKALLMNGTNSFHNTLLGSELRQDYKGLLNTFNVVKEKLQLSVSKNPNGEVNLTQKAKGKKLVEFGIQPDLGLKCQPFIKFLDNTRLRYDPVNQRTIFEVKTNW